jgi:hypothetical protein
MEDYEEQNDYVDQDFNKKDQEYEEDDWNKIIDHNAGHILKST